MGKSGAVDMRSTAIFSRLALAIVLGVMAAPMIPLALCADEPAPQTDTAPSLETCRPTTTPADPADSQPASASTMPADSQPAQAPPTVGWIKLSGPLRDMPSPYAWAASRSDRPTLRQVIARLDHVIQMPQCLGVIFQLKEPALTLSQVQEISTKIKAVRAAGKKVFVFSDSYDLRHYLLACAADGILLQHKGRLELNGLGIEEMYLAGLLEKLGMKADFIQIGQYKGAQDPLTRTSPSDAWSQTMDGLLDSLYEQSLVRLTQDRGMTRTQAIQAMAESWRMTDEDYLHAKLIDRLIDRDIYRFIDEEFSDDCELDEHLGPRQLAVQADNPMLFFQLLMKDNRPKIVRDTIALVHAQGAITSGRSRVASGPQTSLFSGPSIGSETMVQLLDDLRDNPQVKGVVLRIDSPGGSALASEMIWQAIGDLAAKKPVYVSISGMAASGGYYLACAATEIHACPGSIVGSIGVVGGKIITGDLYAKLGIQVHRRSRGPYGDMFNSVEPFTREQRQALETAFIKTYEQFLDRVQSGRGQRITDIHAVAQGRLFTGQMAADNGLVDRLAGLQETINQLADRLELKPEDYDVVELPFPITLGEYFESMFDPDASAPTIAGGATAFWLNPMARAWIGSTAWTQTQNVLAGTLLLNRERVLCLMPTVIIIR